MCVGGQTATSVNVSCAFTVRRDLDISASASKRESGMPGLSNLSCLSMHWVLRLFESSNI
jgi:hypothetical protein